MRWILGLGAIWIAACGTRADSAERASEGVISVRWTGNSTGAFSAPVVARWCAADTLLEVIAVRNDTAVGLSLIVLDSVRPGVYQVSPTRDFTPVRPQAGAALRWLDAFDLRGYDAKGGQITVSASGPKGVSGTFDIQLQPITGTDSLRLTGSFERLPIRPTPPPCGRANRPRAG